MEKGKLIVIEGTDCSGKEKQSRMLIERLNNEGVNSQYYSFPEYSTPTGKIVGISYLGKPNLVEKMVKDETAKIFNNVSTKNRDLDEILSIMRAVHPDEFNQTEKKIINIALESVLNRIDKTKITLEYEVLISVIIDEVIKSLSHGWFPEGAPNVIPKVASSLYATDRLYNLSAIEKILDEGINIILDRYAYSNMAHQGGKIIDTQKREEYYKWDHSLEFDFFGLPLSDIRIFLHMPTDYAAILKRERQEPLDEHEKDPKHLYNAEKAYLEIASKYDFSTIECIRNNHQEEALKEDIKTPEEIHEEVYSCVKKELKLQ